MPVFTSIGLALGSTVAASAAGIGAFGVGVATSAMAAGVYGMSRASQHKASVAGKQARHDADVANRQAIAESAALKAKSASQAKESLLDRQRAMARNKSVFTTSLGITAQANTAKKLLLGE